MITREHVLDILQPYPNLEAVILGCVSGNVAEWPGMRSELARLAEMIAAHDAIRAKLESRIQELSSLCQHLQSKG